MYEYFNKLFICILAIIVIKANKIIQKIMITRKIGRPNLPSVWDRDPSKLDMRT